MSSPADVTSSERDQHGAISALLVAAIVLTGLTMRMAVTSVGAVLTDLQHALHATSLQSGIITTLPLLCFAVIGLTGPRLAHRFGEHQLLVGSLAVMAVGLVARALVSTVWAFALFSVLALTGGAISNVLMPALVKRHFPDRVGTMTAVYTTSLAVGATVAAGLTVPISSAADSWRVGLGSWALLAIVAILPWLATLRGDRPDVEPVSRVPMSRLIGSRTAWALTIFFGFQSLQAYIQFGWFAKYLRDHGVSAAEAGWQVAFLSAMSIPVSMLIPTLAVRGQRRPMLGLVACSLVAYIGLLASPVDGAWLWMLLAGVGSGVFPLALTMIGLRSRTVGVTTALSGFVQPIGYLLAAAGPLLFGALHGATGGWDAPFAVLFAALAIDLVAGLLACRHSFVDDEIASRFARRNSSAVTG